LLESISSRSKAVAAVKSLATVSLLFGVGSAKLDTTADASKQMLSVICILSESS